MNPKEYKLVRVLWNDAESHDTWVQLGDVLKDKTMEVSSVGWLVHDNPDRVVIVASMDLSSGSEQVSGHLQIPRQMVKEIVELQVHKPRAKKKKQIEPTVIQEA